MSDSPNFLTYAQTAFDPFEERPFCAVDSLVFAWLSYLRLPGDMAELTNWQGLDVRELLRAECYRDMIDDLWDPEGSRALLEAVAASPRYRGVHVCGYRAVSDVVATEQFAAMAFRFPVGFSYLSFPGTDSTIVAGKRPLTWRSGVLCRPRNSAGALCGRSGGCDRRAAFVRRSFQGWKPCGVRCGDVLRCRP